MLKNISKLECEIEGRIYQLLCDFDSPIDDVESALLQFIEYVRNVREQAIQTHQELKKEESCCEVS